MSQIHVRQDAPMNVLSVIAFVVSLLGFNVVAIILGGVGLSQVKSRGERGRGFALAGIWIGTISFVIIVIGLILVTVVGVYGASA